MKIDEYKKLIENDMCKHRQYSCEACLDRDFLMLISYFTIIKNARGLRTMENILNSYKVTEGLEGRDIDLTKVPKRIRERVREHAGNAFVRKKVTQQKYIEKEKTDKDDLKEEL